VLHFAQRLKRAGYKPAILTRGYRRASSERSTLLGEREDVPVEVTGDEARLFLRSGAAPVGIGADRYATGMLVENRFGPDVLLLDDGFQHRRLARTVDVVLIDALDPFAGEALVPLGRLREPLEALSRADVFLITRAVPGVPLAGIQSRLSHLNPRAPAFRSRVVPLEWVDLATLDTLTPTAAAAWRALAFCGLANPSAFWHSLSELGCRPAVLSAFRDHHRYRPRELAELAARARAADCNVLLTTEKDVMNLPPDAATIFAPLRLLFLKIGLRIEEEESLQSLVTKAVPLRRREPANSN
jgi:tetraacyldisaccharide 4'-kinase